jgi:hypothetical protein
VWLEALGQLKNPITSSEIEPSTADITFPFITLHSTILMSLSGLAYQQHSGLVFERWSVQISAGTPTILTKIVVIFLSLQANAGIVSQLSHDDFLPIISNSSFIYHLTSQHYIV